MGIRAYGINATKGHANRRIDSAPSIHATPVHRPPACGQSHKEASRDADERREFRPEQASDGERAKREGEARDRASRHTRNPARHWRPR